jgi:methylmalonyl-CoA mutase N-terminal domain/subunit
LKKAAQGDENLMPFLMACAKNYATLGEMVNVLKEVFGEYVEAAEF